MKWERRRKETEREDEGRGGEREHLASPHPHPGDHTQLLSTIDQVAFSYNVVCLYRHV